MPILTSSTKDITGSYPLFNCCVEERPVHIISLMPEPKSVYMCIIEICNESSVRHWVRTVACTL